MLQIIVLTGIRHHKLELLDDAQQLDFRAFLSRARARENRCDVAQILTKG